LARDQGDACLKDMGEIAEMRKDGQPHVFKRVKLKDLYSQIKNGQMTESAFKEWLMFYRYKHWGRGMDDMMNEIKRSNKC
jgi:hypothetical protein